jgi:timeless
LNYKSIVYLFIIKGAAKDLTRYLRRDDPNEKSIRRELLKSDIITNDLIPLMKVLGTKKGDAELFDIVLRLMVNLTQSALNCFDMKQPEDKIKQNIFIEIDNSLQGIKESFADETFSQVLTDKLVTINAKQWEDRPEEEELIVERILYLIRNILAIKTNDTDDNRLETDLNSHDLLILSFKKSKLLDILIEMLKPKSHFNYTIHLLEIVSLIVKDQSPEELVVCCCLLFSTFQLLPTFLIHNKKTKTTLLHLTKKTTTTIQLTHYSQLY